MPRLTIPEGKKVEAAYFDFNVTLKRSLVGEYGTDDLVTMQFRVPVANDGTDVVSKALDSMLETFEGVYGPVMGAPEQPVLGTDDTAREQTLVAAGGTSLEDLPF